jgi:hypothetical protein
MTHTLIGMIYKSLAYLDFMVQSMDSNSLIVANDATPEVLEALPKCGIPFVEYRDNSHDYYLNRVYRAWNYGARCAETDLIVFFNSDMYGASGWLENLLQSVDGYSIPCSRLVESGKQPSGLHGITKDFGRSPETFNKAGFEQYATEISYDCQLSGGLYMPSVFDRKEFLKYGGYPEGNVYKGGIGKHGTGFVRSGDDHFFHHVMKHKRHVTVANSVVYHFQTGEMDA